MQASVTTLAADTHPDVEQLQISSLRQMPVWRKLALVSEMNRTVRALALAGLRQRYPDAGPAELGRRLADLMLGPELAARVYGPLPEQDRC
jgi:hypothetical protein